MRDSAKAWSRLILLLVGTGVACEDPAAPDNPADFPTTASDSVFVGRSARMVLVSTFDSAVVTAGPFTWHSSDTAVAVVDPTGAVFGVGVGTANVEARIGSDRNTRTVRVLAWMQPHEFAAAEATPGAGDVCVRATSGLVHCSDFTRDSAARFVAVTNDVAFAAFSSGTSHRCGITAGGQLYCAGSNSDGQLGTGAPGPASPTFVPAGGAMRFLDVSAGLRTTCAIHAADSVVHCAGPDAAVLGRQGTGDSLAAVDGSLKALAVTVGRSHGCAISLDRAAYCWGINSQGVLGNESDFLSRPPLRIPGEIRFAQLSSGSHTCGISVERELYCWGSNQGGQLGVGPPDDLGHAEPVRVALGGPVARVVAGNGFTCAVTDAGQLYCTGVLPLTSGLAAHYAPRRGTPIALARGIRFSSVATDGGRICGVTEGGGIVCL